MFEAYRNEEVPMVALPLFRDAESLSLYCHIPFCEAKCHYCDFYSGTNAAGMEAFVSAFEQEVALWLERQPHLKTLPVETIFFGGGTPSILSPSQFGRIGAALSQFSLQNLSEWTVECNPESFSEAKADAWLAAGVNRLSFGVQSMDDGVLRTIGRVHSSERVREVLSHPVLSRFDLVSVDLIYGLPSLSLASLEGSLEALTAFPVVKHLSAYELTIAEGTVLAKQRQHFSLPQEEQLEEQMRFVRDWLMRAGYERYEVSNYAREGARCRHNERYWDFSPYLGLGPAAHSFDGLHRFHNAPSSEHYCGVLSAGELPATQDSATLDLESYLFLRFRTADGLCKEEFARLFQASFAETFRAKDIENLRDEGYLFEDVARWYLSDEAMDLADGIALVLMEGLA